MDERHIGRRRLVMIALGAALPLQLQTVQAQSAGTEAQEFQLIVPSALLAGLREAPSYSQLDVRGDPASVDPTRGLPLIYIAVGVLLLPEIARTLVAAYREYKHGGVTIEVRGGKLVIATDERLPANTIVVKDATGKVTIHENRSSADTAKWAEILGSVAKK
jgi:hypothetical protein